MQYGAEKLKKSKSDGSVRLLQHCAKLVSGCYIGETLFSIAVKEKDGEAGEFLAPATGVNPGGWEGVATPRFWAGRLWGVAGGGVGYRGRVVKYYYILSCTGSMFESGDF